MLFNIAIHAQDIIVLKDATEFEAQVLEINDNNVRYKKWNNLEGPTYVINANEIFFIKYANGTKDVLQKMDNESQPSSNTQNVSINNDSQKNTTNGSNEEKFQEQEYPYTRPFIKKIRFHSYPSAAFYVHFKQTSKYGSDWFAYRGRFYGFDLNWSFGARFYDYGYLGVLTGANLNVSANVLSLPIRLHLRGYYPINRKIHPFLEFTCGAEIRLIQPDRKPYEDVGFSCTIITGFDLDHFSIGFGYYYFEEHNLYLKIISVP